MGFYYRTLYAACAKDPDLSRFDTIRVFLAVLWTISDRGGLLFNRLGMKTTCSHREFPVDITGQACAHNLRQQKRGVNS